MLAPPVGMLVAQAVLVLSTEIQPSAPSPQAELEPTADTDPPDPVVGHRRLLPEVPCVEDPRQRTVVAVPVGIAVHEDERLLAGFDGGASVEALATAHERTRAGIEARLVKHGRLEVRA